MVNPVPPRPEAPPSTATTSNAATKPSVPEGLSPGDMQALQRTSGREARSGHQQGGSAPRRAGPQGPAASRSGGGQARRHTDRSLTRPFDEFSVRPIRRGTDVLLSKDGKTLFNLRGELAEAIVRRLSAKLPRSAQPTVWLGDTYGHISVMSIREHLDHAVDPNDGGVIAIRSDGILVLRRDRSEALSDDIVVIERSVVAETRRQPQQRNADRKNQMAESIRRQAAAMNPTGVKRKPENPVG
ncbi:MAG: hypothetical protein AAGA73_00355 [Pseudomonadota bacterium]